MRVELDAIVQGEDMEDCIGRARVLGDEFFGGEEFTLVSLGASPLVMSFDGAVHAFEAKVVYIFDTDNE